MTSAKLPWALPAAPVVHRRHVMVVLCSMCCFLNYADRVNASVAIIPMSAQYHWDVSTQSLFLSAFFFGYMPMQIAGAELCRRLGGKVVLGYAALWWSVFTLLTPPAADLGLRAVLACRFLMGLGEALSFPAIYHFLAAWVPAEERSRSTAVFITGVHCGTTAALFLSPHFIEMHSWRMVFWFFGAAGFGWVVLWFAVAEDCDAHAAVAAPPHATAPQEKRTEGMTRFSSDTAASLTPLHPVDSLAVYRAILGSRACWSVIVVSFANSFAHYTVMAWLPSYFGAVFGVRTEDLGFTFVPYLVMAVATNLSGLAADCLTRCGTELTDVRRIMTVGGNLGAAFFIVMFSRSQSAAEATLLIALALGMQVMNTGGFESSFLDMSDPLYVGTFKATANTISSLAGILCIPSSAMLLSWSGSWRVVFASLCVFYVLGAIVFALFSNSDAILTPAFVRSYTRQQPLSRIKR